MVRTRIAAPVAAAALGLLLAAPACSSNTKDDIKSVGSDLSTDASSNASNLSTNLESSR
jgi:hypothetical protein